MASFAIVATYRESELDRTHPLSEMLITLRRERGITRVALRGLKITHVKHWSIRSSDRCSVTAISGGNGQHRRQSVLRDEMLQHLKETGAIARVSGMTGRTIEIGDLGLSEGIKEVIGQRLSRLSEACIACSALRPSSVANSMPLSSKP